LFAAGASGVEGLSATGDWCKPVNHAIINGLTDARGAPHLYIYLTLLGSTNRAIASGTGFSGSRPNRNIRLMVDVLLTTNEAFRNAAGGRFLFACSNHKWSSAQVICEKKHD